MKDYDNSFKKKLRFVGAAITMAATTAGCTLGSNVLQNPNPIMQEQKIDGEGYFATLKGNLNEYKRLVIHDESVPEETMAYVVGDNVFVLDGARVKVFNVTDLSFLGIEIQPISLDCIIDDEIVYLERIDDEKKSVVLKKGDKIKILPQFGGTTEVCEIYDLGVTKVIENGKRKNVCVKVPRRVKKISADGDKLSPTSIDSQDINIAIVQSNTNITNKYTGKMEQENKDIAYFSIKKEKEDDVKYYLIGRDSSRIPVDESCIMEYSSLEEAAKEAMESNIEEVNVIR